MKNKFIFSLSIILIIQAIPANAVVKAGAACKNAGITSDAGNKTFTCIKSGKKLVWDKGLILKPTSTSPTANITDKSNYLDISSCKLLNGSNNTGVNQSFQQNNFRVRNTKLIRALIFPIDFPDLVGNSNPQKDFSYVAEGVSDYFKEMSDGKSIFSWTIYPKYVRYGSSVADAKLGGRTTSGYWPFSVEAYILAKQTLDTSLFDLIVYAPPLTTTREQIAIGPAFVANNSSQINATMLDGQSYEAKFPFTTVHEIGHLMGLADLYNFEAANEAAAKSGSQNANDLQFKYMGIFDLMNWAGGAGVELTAWNRWLIDLINDDQVRCLPNTSTTTLLTPVEVKGGVKGAVIPLSSTEAIVIESRRAIRYDKNLNKISEGALLYKVNTSIPSGFGPMRVVGRTGSTDIFLSDAPLKLKESVTVDGYTIQVVESGVFGDVIKVNKN